MNGESGLSAFMRENAEAAQPVKYPASQRFRGKDGAPLEWEIRAVSSEENERLQRECQKRVPVPGKYQRFTWETDASLYLGKLAAACTVFPNLNDAELQNSYGVMGADALLKAMLLPGEYADYALEVQKVNGFDADINELADQAKN